MYNHIHMHIHTNEYQNEEFLRVVLLQFHKKVAS